MDSSTTWLQHEEERELELRRLRSFGAVLLARRKLLYKWLVFGAVVGVIAAFVWPRSYEGKVRLMPPSSGGSILSALPSLAGGGGSSTEVLSALAADRFGIKSSGALYVGVLGSRTIQDRLINKFDLRRVYWESTYEGARKELDSRSSFSEDRKSGIISIVVRDHDKQRAAALASAYADELNAVLVETNTSQAHKERVFLEDRLKLLKTQLDVDSADLAKFATASGAIDIPQQAKGIVDAAARLQGELVAARSELSGLEQIYAADDVRVRAARARIQELERALEKLTGTGSVDQSTDSIPALRKLPQLALRYSDLYRRLKIDEAVYETLTKQYELAKVQEAKEIPTVKRLDDAEVPERKASPSTVAVMGITEVLCLAVCLLLLYSSYAWNRLPEESTTNRMLAAIGADISSSKWGAPLRRLFGPMVRSLRRMSV